ncbi:hypothetical protein C0992_008557 [Termitomyces sp. T32_za158]|nr:hypothetical protein C0992_008557 [Termitomyces sp. T32_za158]
MSSNCPPQLHLELPPNTTSFKRSFDQFGFDLDSPQGASDAAGASASDGNDRNKRARSASSFSDDDDSITSSSSSTLASGSSPISGDSSTHDSLSSHLAPPTRAAVPHLSLNISRSALEPPRLPTPEIQDIDMADYPPREPGETGEASPVSQANSISAASPTSQAEEHYRLSLERFNAFDSQIAALRRSRSPSLPRSPTPPPVLPPLELLGGEVPMNTSSISFLHPPAQPSPPLPHSLYSHGPSRNQQPGSRSTSRNELLLDDPRRLPHETHAEPLPIAESSISSRADLTDGGSRTDEEWNRITQNVRSARGDEAYRRGTPWSFWPTPGEGAGDGDGNEGDEEEEEEVQEVLEHPSHGDIWSSPVPPTLGELRSPSPLFNHLDDIDSQPPPVPALRRPGQVVAPPTLPPIEDQVLSHPWDPMEEMLDTVWSRYPGDRMPQTTQQSQPHQGSIQPQPPSRITILSERERELTPAEDNVSVSATTGSVSDIASPVPAHISAHAHAVSTPNFVAWFDRDEPWYLRAPEQEPGPSSGQASRGPSSTHAHLTANMSTSSHSASSSNHGEPSSSASAATATVSPSILDTYAASRLQALQGIGTALEGIGHVLRESEFTLAPYLREGSSSSSGNIANTNIGNGSTSTSMVNATVGEARRASRSPVRGGAEVRTSAWRSISSSSTTSGEGIRQRVREETMRSTGTTRVNAPVVPSDNIELDWPMRGESAESLLLPDGIPENEAESFRDAVERIARHLPSTASTGSLETLLPDSTSESETENYRDVTERMMRHAPSVATTGSLERLRQRAVALEAAVRHMDERWPDRSVGTSGDGQIDGQRSGSPYPSMRLTEPVESILSPWDNAPGTSSGRDRSLPTNTSMLFHDGPSTSQSAFSNDSQPATSTTDQTFVSGWRSVEPVIPRVREPPSRSPEREREIERERMRLTERPWLRPPRTSSPLFPGTSLNNLRARPYVSQSSTHAHGHSYPQTHSSVSYSPLLSAGPTESAADAQRRIARLGLIQMQRQRANSGRMPSVESPFNSSASSTFATRPLPPRPRGFDTFPPRSSSPDRNGYRMRLAEQRARLDGIREPDTTSSLYDAALDTLDMFNVARPSRNPSESSAERPHPTSGLRFARRAFDRSGESASSAEPSSISTVSSGSNSRRLRFPTLENLDRTIREDYLSAPSLPSPGLEFEFVPAPPSNINGPSASEPHDDHRTINARSSNSDVSHAAPARRSPSPVLRRFERSPPRRPSPPGLPRYLDPEALEAFAPGPFRNTIQSYWSARNNRSGSRPRASPAQGAAAQSQSHVTPPSLPPLAFEEEHRSAAQRPDRSSGDFAPYRNGFDDTATARLRAFLNRHPLPPPDRPPTPQRYAEVLHQLDAPLNVLDRILMPQSNPTQSTATSADSLSDNRNIFDATPGWLDGDNLSHRRPSTSSYRPPWRAVHPSRVPSNPPSDIHTLLNRLPRTEAIRRETSRRPPPLRGNEDGLSHAIEALRNDRLNAARSQDVLNRTQFDASREPRTRATASPWGILEQSQGSGVSRRTNTSNEQSNSELSGTQRRRRHVLPIRPDPFPPFPIMDIDDDVIDTATLLQDRARFLSRRVRGPGGEAPVFPRRIPTLMRSNGARRGRPLGDYIPDEDWNSDYESLLSLAAQLGEVKPRSTPAEVIDSMETGLYKDWKTADSDHRCPICLDDTIPFSSSLTVLTGCIANAYSNGSKVLPLAQFVVKPSLVLRMECLSMKLVQVIG